MGRTTGSGPQHGGGRAAYPFEAVRGKRVQSMFRAQEFRDLTELADAWGVPLATVAWALVSDRLAELRGLAFNGQQSGIVGAAARYIVAASQRGPGADALERVARELEALAGS